jgi:hypothetical protein
LKPRGANLFSTGQPALYLENGTSIPYSGYGFDATTSEQIFLDFKVPFYLSGNLTVTLRWYSQTGQTSNAVVWGVQLAALSAGDAQSVLTDALATAQTTTTTVNGTARGSTETVVTVTNLDSLAADDTVQMRIYRDAAAGGDTMTGDAILFDVEVEYAATGGTGAGNVSNAGASTDNAVARFDLATGQVIQNSGVIVDDSDMVTAARFIGPATALRSATTSVDVAAATAPTSGQVLTATGGTAATWQTPSGGGSGDVVGPGSATDNAIARFDTTTGKLIQNSAVTIADTTGHITQPAGGQLNGVDVTNLDARLNPAGADTMFPGTWAAGDAPIWNGSIWVPKCRATVTLASDQDITSTLTDLSGVSQALRVGQFLVYINGNYTTDTTARDFGVALNFSGTATMHMEGYVYATVAAGVFGNVSAFNTVIENTGTATAGTRLGFVLRAEVVVTVAGTLVLRCDTDSNTGVVLCKAGSGMTIFET